MTSSYTEAGQNTATVAARLDAMIERWSDAEPGSQLTELVKLRALLGQAPGVALADGAPRAVLGTDEAVLAEAGRRLSAAVRAVQSTAGVSEHIVALRDLASTMELHASGRYAVTRANLATRDRAVYVAGALLTGQLLALPD